MAIDKMYSVLFNSAIVLGNTMDSVRTNNSQTEHFKTKVTLRPICSEMLPFILYLTP